MANKIIKHYYDEPTDTRFNLEPEFNLEPDKTKSISELSLAELRRMLERLRSEREVEDVIMDLKRRSGEKDTYEQPFIIDTTTPINQLYHHGILGQKWGVRRFQNKDGTRTPAGKRREKQSSKSEDHTILTGNLQNGIRKQFKSRDSKSKAPDGLSNEELKKINERLQLEETYKRLTAEKIQKSESFVKKAIKNGGEQALTEFSKGIFLGSAKLLVKELSPEVAELAFKIKDKKD